MIINNKILNNANNALIISGDAGGAEVLFRLCKKIRCKKKYYLKGPAKKIFNNKKNIKSSDIKKIILQSEALICTSSMDDITYYEAIQFAKKNNIFTLLVLDHWTFYSERILKKKHDQLPDKVLIFDNYAKNILKNLFPKIQFKILPNPYLNEIVKKITLSKNNNDNKEILDVLYCTDINKTIKTNITGVNFKKYSYSEFEAMEFFFENIDFFQKKINKIIIRTHPSESTNKYNKLINRYSKKFNILKDNSKSLASQVIRSNMVVGCDTFPMVIGIYTNKEVICCIPPCESRCSLPFKKIKYLRDIIH